MAQYQEKLVLDVKEKTHRNVIFRPLHMAMRPEINVTNMTRAPNDRLFMVGGMIPGDRFVVDFKNLRWSLTDKLTLKENKELAGKIKSLMKSDPVNPQSVEFHDELTGDFSGDPDTVATFLWHIWSHVQDKTFTIVEGKLPSKDEIRLIGRVQLSEGTGLPEKIAEKACFLPKLEPVGAK